MCSSETITDASGTITSPGYGIQYPNYAACMWTFQVDVRYSIRLTFSDFDLETGRDNLFITGSRAVPLSRLVSPIFRSFDFKKRCEFQIWFVKETMLGAPNLLFFFWELIP